MTGGATGRFPGFNVLGQARHWDSVTAGMITARTGPPPRPRFFTEAEQASAAALLDQLTGQCDEPVGVPVLEMVDARLAAGGLTRANVAAALGLTDEQVAELWKDQR